MLECFQTFGPSSNCRQKVLFVRFPLSVMSKNVLYCVLGVVLGFAVGFFVSNSVTRPGAPAAPPPRPSGAVARTPSSDQQSSGKLPPGHPNVAGVDTDAGDATAPAQPSVASTSADAQAAMD